MKNILFPSDFSKISQNAFAYALEFARHMDSKIIVFHAYEEGAPISEETKQAYSELDILNIRKTKDKFKPFEDMMEQTNSSVKVKYVVKQGDFFETLSKYIAKKEDKIDLVVLGTHDCKPKLFEIFMETNTLKLLSEINKPVVSVPENATFDGTLDRVLFLVDYREEEVEAFEEVMDQVRSMNCALHVVHFDLSHGDSITSRMEVFKEQLNFKEKEEVVFNSIDTLDIKKSLMQYCEDNRIDLVYLINHKRNFYQRLFSYSLAEDIIRSTDIAVQAIYRD